VGLELIGREIDPAFTTLIRERTITSGRTLRRRMPMRLNRDTEAPESQAWTQRLMNWKAIARRTSSTRPPTIRTPTTIGFIWFPPGWCEDLDGSEPTREPLPPHHLIEGGLEMRVTPSPGSQSIVSRPPPRSDRGPSFTGRIRGFSHRSWIGGLCSAGSTHPTDGNTWQRSEHRSKDASARCKSDSEREARRQRRPRSGNGASGAAWTNARLRTKGPWAP
jgi:hypothetical protein